MPFCGKRRKNMKMLDILLTASSLLVLTVSVDFAAVDAASGGKSIPPIYWNTSAPIFKDQHSHVQYVNIGQKMDIICPLRNPKRPDEPLYFTLYKVSRTNYDNCDTSGQKKLLTCDDPFREKKYTFLFEDITPSPWGLTFRPDETYYFISTSDGTEAGIRNSKGGACTEKNMKLMISVRPRDHTTRLDKRPVVPDVAAVEKTTSSPRYINSRLPPSYHNRNDQHQRPVDGEIRQGESGKDDADANNNNNNNSNNNNNVEMVNSNGLVIGVVLGACAVLFVVLLGFLGYKVYRKRRSVKKYQSPGIGVAARGGAPQAQVTLLPISSHPGTHIRSHTARSAHLHPHMQDMPAPPPYNESILDHAGSTMEV